ncbi:unnamed protein product [Hapterophycus canaliculatus]
MATVDKHMLKELLLVCSALGSVETSEPGDGDGEKLVGQHQRFVRGENCLEWLQDLQRALRRDDDNTREICIILSSWRVVQHKLVPLILECRDDAVLVNTLFKIYVMLTMPLSKQAEEALSKAINPKAQGDIRDQQTRRRENAVSQQAALHAFKRAFVSKDVLSVVVGMLEEPLSHTGVARTDEDNFSIELCLTLLRNVLNIEDPTTGMSTSLGDHYSQMHEQLIALFKDALLLDILLLLAQDVHARENAKLNLLLVEIFHCIIRDQEPRDVIAAHRLQAQKEAFKGPSGGISPARQSGGSLMSVLVKEKAKRGLGAGQMHSRHARFGGTLQVGGGNGTTARMVANPFKDRVDCVPQATRKKTKRGKTFTVDDVSGTSSGLSDSHKATLAREALYEFCCSFLKTAYDPFMRSIKNEFRIDSSRLQPGDKGMMFRLMYFFMSFHHQLHQAAVKDAIEAGRKGAGLPKFELGHVLETMDLMSFNLVLREVETAISEKSTKRLAECVAVLKEMMHIVAMLNESSERAHQLVALGLLARIFYASEPLDKLHDIVRNWQPGKHTKSFLCHLVELVHTTLKTLEWYTNDRAKFIGGVDVNMVDSENVEGKVDKAVLDRVASAKQFDFQRYFRRLATNSTVRMYSNLLEHYATNSVRTNHYILSFMMRLSNFTGDVSKKRRGERIEMDNGHSGDRVTFEPMLYNVYTLGVFQKVLDDPFTRKSSFKHLVHFILSIVRHFGALAQKNHLVFVEAFFQHPHPHQFCESLVNIYHDASSANSEDPEPRKKRATDKAKDSDEESEESDTQGQHDTASRGQPATRTDSGQEDLGGDDEADEEEWDESAPIANQEETHAGSPSTQDRQEMSIDGKTKRKRDKGARRRRKDGEEGKIAHGSEKKKRAPRWSKKEDAYLREQFPLYAGTSSAFEVLVAADEMEAKQRTEEQIKARVKKLGLTAAYPAKVGGGENADNPGEGGSIVDISDEQETSNRSRSAAKPVHTRKLQRKSQAVSDDDSDGLFSSAEDNDGAAVGGRSEETSTSQLSARPSRRPVFEESSDED